MLEDEGFLKRVHGGAVLESADDISKRLVVNYEKKQRIARAAAAYVKEGESILIEVRVHKRHPREGAGASGKASPSSPRTCSLPGS